MTSSEYGHTGSSTLVTKHFLHHDTDYQEISICLDQNTNNIVTT